MQATKTKTMKITSILLTLVMLVSMLSVSAVTAFAADGTSYTDTNGDGIYEDAEGNFYIQDPENEGGFIQVTDTDADGVYEHESGLYYLPDGNGNFTELTDTNGDGIYEDANGKKYVTAAAVEKLTQELKEAISKLATAEDEVDYLLYEINNVYGKLNGLNDTYATDDEVEEAINDAMNVLMSDYTRMLGEAIHSLEYMINEKADSKTLEDEIKRLEALINGLDGTFATDTEVAEAIDQAKSVLKEAWEEAIANAVADLEAKIAEQIDPNELQTEINNLIVKIEAAQDFAISLNNALTAEMQEVLNELNERLVALENRTAEFKVENGNLYVRYDENEEWTLIGTVQGADGEDGKDGTNGVDGKTPTFKVENDVLYVSYDNGTSWTELGNIGGSDGTNGNDGQDGADGADGADGKTPTFKIENGELKVSYDDGATWTSLGNIQGADGSNGTNGNNGQDGADGADGADGKTPTFKIENGELKVSYDDGATWTSLGNIQGINGANGADGEDGKNGTNGSNGKDGENGKDGITPQLRINSETNEWEVSYDNGKTWTSLGVKATGDKGDKGDTGAAGADGKDGVDGKDGADGEDGLAVVAIIIGSVALVSNIALVAYILSKKKKVF